MAIFADENTRVIVQGITGRDGAFHTRSMLEYGTKVVGGVTPGKGGQCLEGVPVFDTVAKAVAGTGANASVIFVPAVAAMDAMYEAADAGLQLVVCITEGVPAGDMLKVWNYVHCSRTRIIGPNCPGIISPPSTKLGIIPGSIVRPGNIGVVSRSGTLTYEVVDCLTREGLGQSTCLGVGGDPFIGTNFIDALKAFEQDPATHAVVMIGEIGGDDEEQAAALVTRELRKPVVAFISGRTAPAGVRMGHAGAIVSGAAGTAASKIAALEAAGIPVAETPSQIPGLLRAKLSSR